MNVIVKKVQKNHLQPQLELLHHRKEIWRDMKPSQRLTYLEKMLCHIQTLDHKVWGELSSDRQGYDPKSYRGEVISAAEEMVSSVIITGTIRALIRSYKALKQSATLPQVMSRSSKVGPQYIASVFPHDLSDHLQPFALAGIKGEIWTKSGKPVQSFTNNGQVSLVLGAGNQSFLAFGDIMHEMFVKGNVTILKHHPVRDFCAPFYEILMSDLIHDGFFASTLGGIEVSSWLCEHPLVEVIHMTGGKATHDAIIWGTEPQEQVQRKAKNKPILDKPITSELGCVTPWIICSGTEWTDKELRRHASQLAKAFVSQNSCNCLSPKLVVLDQDWPQSDQFIAYLRKCLKIVKSPPAYYPGSLDRFRSFIEVYPDHALELIETDPDSSRSNHGLGDTLGWLLIHMNEDSDQYAIQNEAFSPVLAIYRLGGDNKCDTFLPKAVSFVNEKAWGTLSCSIFFHDQLEESHADTLETAIAKLRYGSVAVNVWTSFVYGIDGCTWGAFPGEPLNNVASGIGFVRNAFMIKNVEKSVLRAPFINSGQLLLGKDGGDVFSAKQYRAISKLSLKPSLLNMIKLLWHMIFSRPT